MAIWLTETSKVIVQGMTGSEGMKHTQRMLDSGTDIVGGVNPRKAGESAAFADVLVPVFGTVAEAMAKTGADVSVVFVPPAFTKAAAIEAVDAGIGLLVVITEGVPVHDTAEFRAYAEAKGATRIIGPNCPGLISPGKSNAGIIQAFALLADRGEPITHPLVVRLDGNNAELGRRILTEANLPHLEQVDTMDGAAHRAAELAAQEA